MNRRDILLGLSVLPLAGAAGQTFDPQEEATAPVAEEWHPKRS